MFVVGFLVQLRREMKIDVVIMVFIPETIESEERQVYAFPTSGLRQFAGVDCGKVIQHRFGQFSSSRCEAGMEPQASPVCSSFFSTY